jgi:transposase-like protein
MYLYGNGCREPCSDVVDRFGINKNQVKMIFVDETLIQIDGQDYWLWIAYEPNIDLCLMVHIYVKRKNYIRMLSILQGITKEIWQKTHIYRWC